MALLPEHDLITIQSHRRYETALPHGARLKGFLPQRFRTMASMKGGRRKGFPSLPMTPRFLSSRRTQHALLSMRLCALTPASFQCLRMLGRASEQDGVLS